MGASRLFSTVTRSRPVSARNVTSREGMCSPVKVEATVSASGWYALCQSSSWPRHRVEASWASESAELPWNQETEDNFDIAHVREVLDSDHYGLEDVKERIVEYVAVRKLAKISPEASMSVYSLMFFR